MSGKKLLPILIIYLAVLLIPSIAFGANAVEVLRRSKDADKYVSYRGLKIVNVYFSGRSAASTLKVIHLKPNKTRTEYFTPVQLAGTVLVEDELNVWKFDPRESEWEKVCVRSSKCGSWDKALENYDVEMIGSDRVAGRPAYVIHAVPRMSGERAHRVWIDKDYYLTIRTEVESPHGAVIDSSRYTDIDINPGDISPSIFTIAGKVKSTPKNKSNITNVVKPSYLPKGYKLAAVGSLSINCSCCAHLQFSNGVNTISMFQRPTDKCAETSRIGSKTSNALTWARGGVLYTLMGKISRSELQKIADSTR